MEVHKVKTKLNDGTFILVDVKNKFFDTFNPVTSDQFRSDILDENGDSTNKDPFKKNISITTRHWYYG